MFCKNCGTQISDNVKFCDNCGAQTDAEQANILSQQEKNRQETPSDFFDVKMAVIITAVFFVIMPVLCLYAEVPVILGLVTAGVLSVLLLILGIRNQIKNKKQKER